MITPPKATKNFFKSLPNDDECELEGESDLEYEKDREVLLPMDLLRLEYEPCLECEADLEDERDRGVLPTDLFKLE